MNHQLSMINYQYHCRPIPQQNPASLALIEAEILFEKKIAAESRKKLPELRIDKA
ncbi:hypothetical protein [Chryseobacterium camelliae]|uniref:hypothetical protein n=1 Tax=Chryseobacterium camelliae TaxID=1265445 RepID=UPI0015621117|nr:hypothetical protein [Chryseobacterium camelliae]